jgi:hypothetical protein
MLVLRVLLLIVLFGSPFFAYFAMTSGVSRDDLNRPFRFLNWTFAVLIVGLIALVALGTMMGDDQPQPSPVVQLLLFALIVAWAANGFAFWVALGVLAKRLHRSPIIWIGAAFLTNPVGPFVAYFMMRGNVKEALRSAVARS